MGWGHAGGVGWGLGRVITKWSLASKHNKGLGHWHSHTGSLTISSHTGSLTISLKKKKKKRPDTKNDQPNPPISKGTNRPTSFSSQRVISYTNIYKFLLIVNFSGSSYIYKC